MVPGSMEKPLSISRDGFPSLEAQRDAPSAPDSPSQASGSRPPSPDLENPQTTTVTDPVSLEEALDALSLDERKSDRMFRALATILRASQLQDARITFDPRQEDDIWVLLQQADAAESQGLRDVALLVAIKNALDQMLWYHSQLLLPALTVIADASRDESWRLPFGQAGILDLALNIIATHHTGNDLLVHALRLVGNSCADADVNRQRLIERDSLQSIIVKLDNADITTVAIPVLYNICCDYEPAQQQALRNGLYPALIHVLESGTADSKPSFGHLCRLLDLVLDSFDETQSPENSVEVLLRAATKPGLDVDDCASLVDSAVAHLKSERYQQYMITNNLSDVPLKFLVRSYFPEANLSGTNVPTIGSMVVPVREAGEEEELSRIRKSIIQALSDVSALPEFTAKYYSLDSNLIESLTKWLTASLPQLQLCSCIILGNLARSDNICIAMVSHLGLHRDLIMILKGSSDTQVIHSALGHLRNLALPQGNKNTLGDAGTIEALARFWTSETLPQISHLAAGVARQLVNGSLANVRKLLTSLSPDPESPAHSRTYLSLLLSVFERSDETTVKMEIARVVTAILRCIHSDNNLQPRGKEDILHRLYSLHGNIGNPLGTMVSQSRYPIIRSEGWFAMALVARSQEGSTAIHGVVSDVSVFSALEATVRGESSQSSSGQRSSTASTPLRDVVSPLSADSPTGPSLQESQEMGVRDRQNAMVLVNELLRNGDDDLIGHIERNALEDLLNVGSRLEEP